MESTAGRKSTLIFVSVASFITIFNSAATNLALPRLGKELNLDAIFLSWIPTAYLLASGAVLIPIGKVADMIGRKKIFQGGLLAFALGSLFTVLVSTSTPLMLARILTGIGAAMIVATSSAIITSVFPKEEKGKALGVMQGVMHFGLAMGPFAGGFVVQHFGWRGVFVALIPLCLIALFGSMMWKGDWAEAKGNKFDWAGCTVYNFALIAFIIGFSKILMDWGQALLVAGILGLLAFVWVETKAETPVLDMGLLRRNRLFSFSIWAVLAYQVCTFAISFLLSLYLQNAKGYRPQDVGIILFAQPITMAILSPIWGRLSDRIEPRVLCSIGYVLTIVALQLFFAMTEATGITYLVFCLILMGVGFSMFSAPNYTAVMSSVDKKFFGVASGTMGTTRMAGSTMSMAVVTMVFSVYIGKVKVTPEVLLSFLQSMRVIFIIFSVIALVGLCFSIFRGRIRNPGIEPAAVKPAKATVA